MFHLHDHDVPAFRLQSTNGILHALHVAGGSIRRRGCARVGQAGQLLETQRLAAPDGEQSLAAGRRGHLDVDDVQRAMGWHEPEAR